MYAILMQSRWHLKNQKIDQHQKLYQQIKIKINMSKVRKIDQKLYQQMKIWNIKDNNVNYNIKWKTVDQIPKFNPITKKCWLCIKETYFLIFQPDGAKLNDRSELYYTALAGIELSSYYVIFNPEISLK